MKTMRNDLLTMYQQIQETPALSDGTIAEEGSPADLLAQKGSAFRRMAQLQTASAEWSI